MVAVLVGLASASRAFAEAEESQDAYDIVGRAAIAVLPEELRAGFAPHEDALRAAALAELLDQAAPATRGQSFTRHYVVWDPAAPNAAPALPDTAQAAFDQFEKNHRDTPHRDLFGAIEEHYSALVDAFRARSIDRVIAEAGALIHYAADAALPYSALADRNAARGVSLAGASPQERASTERSVTPRQRFNVELFRRLRARLAFEVRPFPDRYAPVWERGRLVVTTLFEADEATAMLDAMDAEILHELQISDVRAFGASAAEYYDRLAERAGWVIRARLEAGAVLAARLIGSAWVDAGRPVVGELAEAKVETADAKESTAPPSASDPVQPSAFVGSRNSLTYHRATCSHAQRIAAANLVRFDSVEAAMRAGRRPCRTCRPGAP